jgi:hypothetical protein
MKASDALVRAPEGGAYLQRGGRLQRDCHRAVEPADPPDHPVEVIEIDGFRDVRVCVPPRAHHARRCPFWFLRALRSGYRLGQGG